MTHYEYVRVQIVGSEGDWETSYSRSEQFPTATDASLNGLRDLDHDDFLVAGVDGSRLVYLTDARGHSLPEWRRRDYQSTARGMDLTWNGCSRCGKELVHFMPLSGTWYCHDGANATESTCYQLAKKEAGYG